VVDGALLAGRPDRLAGPLLPTAFATGFCLTGLAVLLYYLIGAGVCLLLGAVFSQMWSERHRSTHSVLRQR
jgi:hypothetical protein